jgi:type IV secretion system protein VirB8
MLSFFRKNLKKQDKSDQRNWYSDRYQSAVVQRNFLALIVVIALVGIAASVLTVVKISSSQKIHPFVIEVEETTGITTIIRPLLVEKFTYNETLKRYFITQYINARESYNYHSHEYSFNQVVRLLSSPLVYSNFRTKIGAGYSGSPLRLTNKATRDIKIKSITFLKPQTAQVRFKSFDQSGNKTRNERHLISTISFEYTDMNLSKAQRAINPLGFQVMSYSIVEDAIK